MACFRLDSIPLLMWRQSKVCFGLASLLLHKVFLEN
jgi:hypothetical protein